MGSQVLWGYQVLLGTICAGPQLSLAETSMSICGLFFISPNTGGLIISNGAEYACDDNCGLAPLLANKVYIYTYTYVSEYLQETCWPKLAGQEEKPLAGWLSDQSRHILLATPNLFLSPFMLKQLGQKLCTV